MSHHGLPSRTAFRPNKGHPLNQGLAAWWLAVPGRNGWGTMQWLDMSGNNYHGTLTTAEPSDWKASLMRPGGWGTFDFGGADDDKRIVVAHDAITNLPLNPFTVSFWAYGVTYSNSIDVSLAWHGTDDLVFYPYDDAGSTPGVRVFWRDCGGSLINEANQTRLGWNWFCFTVRASADIQAYANGVSVGTAAFSTAGAGPFTGFTIGAFEEGLTQERNGPMDDIRLLSRGLRRDEVYQLYIESLTGYPTMLDQMRIPFPFASAAIGNRRRRVLCAGRN